MDTRHGLTVTFNIRSKTIDWELLVFPITNSSLLGYNLMQAHDVVIHTCGKVFIGDILVTAGQEIGTLQNDEMYDGSDYCVTRGDLRKSHHHASCI